MWTRRENLNLSVFVDILGVMKCYPFELQDSKLCESNIVLITTCHFNNDYNGLDLGEGQIKGALSYLIPYLC